ncbi:hypothetical protein Tco_1235347 [Tanacetum coccineum]
MLLHSPMPLKLLLLKNTTPPPASVKAVEESCVTYGGPHPYYQLSLPHGNDSWLSKFNISTICLCSPQLNYNQGIAGHRPRVLLIKVRTTQFSPVQNNQNRLSLPELTPTQMILELADRSTTRPTGIVEDVFVSCRGACFIDYRKLNDLPSIKKFPVTFIDQMYRSIIFGNDLQTLGNTSNQLKQEEQDGSQYWKPPVYYSDDDDDFNRESIDETPPSNAITPDLPITDSLVMEDEHLTILEMDSDEEIESSVKNLNLTPSECEDLSDYVSECDLPFCDNSPDFNNDSEIFSNPLFDSNADYTPSDDESSSEEDVLVENFKIYSNPLLEFDEEIFSSEINPLYNDVLEDLDSIPPGNENDHFNAESDLIESLLNKDTVITSPKIDFLLEEFAGELALINPIPPEIAETNFDPKEDIRLIKKLLYDNSSPRPPEELNSKISEAIIESFSSSPIHIPSGIDSDGYDSEEDNLFLKYDPDPGELTRVVVEDIFGEPRVHMPNVLPTHPILCQDMDFTLSTDFSGSDLVISFPSRNRNKTFDPGISIEVQSKRFLSLNKFSISFISDPFSPVLETLLPFSFEIKDNVFNHGILVSKEEKSPHPYLIGALKLSRSFIISLMKAR